MAVSPEAATGKPLRIPQIVRAPARMPLLVVIFFKLGPPLCEQQPWLKLRRWVESSAAGVTGL